MRSSRISILIAAALTLASCGTTKKTTDVGTVTPGTGVGQTSKPSTDNQGDNVIAMVGDWQTMQTGGNIALKGGSSFSSSIQLRMVRDEAIFISLRPLLGIEVGKLLITADSVYAVDKVHKRYVAEQVSVLTSGIPVTVSDVQDIFLGRPFIIGKGTLCGELKPLLDITQVGNNVVMTPKDQYRGYSYSFTFNKSGRISSLDIFPVGATKATYQVKYADVKSTAAGNIAHEVNVDAAAQKKKFSFSLDYKTIDWNGSVKIYKNIIPKGYTRMSAADLFSLFSN